MGTTSTSSIFNGTSRFSQDFQNVITRAQGIASLGISQLNNDKAVLSKQTTAMKGLDDLFRKLRDAAAGLQSALDGSNFQAQVSDTGKLTATVGSGAVEQNYSVEVLDPGAQGTSLTKTSWVNDTDTHDYKLQVGGKTYSLSPANNSAESVAAAINAQYGDLVHASVVNGSGTDKRISLQATSLGDSQPDILDGTTSLQDQKITGSQTEYIVDGIGTGTFSNSQSLQIASGVTVTLKAKTNGTPVNVTVTRSTTALNDAMNAFVTAYNNAVDAVDQHRGLAGGELAGNPVARELSGVLSEIPTYAGTGSIYGLKALGVELSNDNSGHLEFNQYKLMAADITSPSAVTSFLGDGTTGGFLKSLTTLLDRVEAPATGLLPAAEAAVTSQSNEIDTEIANQQSRVDDMVSAMQLQMSRADAMIASMEQQYSYLFGMFSAMQTAAGQYK
jgi:flagellar hook-associated protein 2